MEANVKEIAFFHHEPTYSDAKLVDIFRQTEKYLKLVAPKQDLKMFLSYEGLFGRSSQIPLGVGPTGNGFIWLAQSCLGLTCSCPVLPLRYWFSEAFRHGRSR